MDEKRYFRSYDGVTLMYRRWQPVEHQKKVPIVLLHGAASNSTRWWHFIEHTQLTRNRTIFRPDLRGNGESMWHGTADIQHWIKDLAAMLDHEQREEAVVVGHCLGANIALHFAAHYPEHSTGLILIEPMASNAVTGILARLKSITWLLHCTVFMFNLIERAGLRRRKFKIVDLRELDYPVHQASAESRRQALSRHGSIWQNLKVTPVSQYVKNFIALLRPLPVTMIRCPGLIIQSSGTSMTDPEKTRDLFGALPAIEFVEMESEHWIPAAHPDILCCLIDGWVTRHHDII
ncbi:alpha/beta fold hydrolase [Nitrosomonas marina]|uniref:Pimeloyl-ACP methyl ester carboxylesterase n=1 Tax=Nitrosomonas marina TaxID=917 RepID=A0A1H8F6Q0_9PROT|nr:alpha/beta hydrolase [Nitrosomonas marina]SEN27054.1 Pimeloyl-ACP methyl ester carboxylesterase [Nitrosomonas marina]